MPMDDPAAEGLFKDLCAFQAEKAGEALFLSYIQDRLKELEPIHFDYKTKRDRSSSDLHDDDKVNVSKAVSGFANSAGGVLIWGIEDETLKPKPISDIVQFMGKVQQLACDCVFPRVSGIQAGFIPTKSEAGKAGYGLLLVPSSSAPPHQVILTIAKVQHFYFVRSGGQFNKADHYQLEDMFGRRPKPIFKIAFCAAEWRTPKEWRLRFELRNAGRGTARDVLLVVNLDNGIIRGPNSYNVWEEVMCDLFKPGGMVYRLKWNIIHPTLVEAVWGLHLMESQRQIGPNVKVEYRIFADGIAPQDGSLEFPFPT